MTSRPTPRLNHKLAWVRQSNTRASIVVGVRAELAGPEKGKLLSDAMFCALAKRWQEGQRPSTEGLRASLREDYLSQVQRDFLSRPEEQHP
jgi:hypothetical protein